MPSPARPKSDTGMCESPSAITGRRVCEEGEAHRSRVSVRHAAGARCAGNTLPGLLVSVARKFMCLALDFQDFSGCSPERLAVGRDRNRADAGLEGELPRTPDRGVCARVPGRHGARAGSGGFGKLGPQQPVLLRARARGVRRPGRRPRRPVVVRRPAPLMAGGVRECLDRPCRARSLAPAGWPARAEQVILPGVSHAHPLGGPRARRLDRPRLRTAPPCRRRRRPARRHGPSG